MPCAQKEWESLAPWSLNTGGGGVLSTGGSILLSGTGWEELEEDGGKGDGRMNAWNDSWEEFLSGFKFDSRDMIGW